MTPSRPLVLGDHWKCFEGVIPSVVVTASRDGTPNVSYISHVFLIDEDHVALSNQFMSKTVRNLQENPRLQASIVHPETGHQLILDLIFERSEESGPLFDRLALCVTAVAAHQGMDRVMRLRSADVYRVLKVSCEDRGPEDPAFVAVPPDDAAMRVIPICLRLSRLDDLGQAVDLALDATQDLLAGAPCIAFLADSDQRVLTAVASRGHDRQGAGAEVRWGEGVVGMAAAGAQSLRFSCVGRQFLYINGVKAVGHLSPDPSRVIPMPGLAAPQSLLAVPMMAGGEVRGVIFAEAETRLAFSPAQALGVELVASHLGGLVTVLGHATEADSALVPAGPDRTASSAGSPLRVDHHHYDDSVFIDHEYVIKGVPGRILWRMLCLYNEQARSAFTNREFRLDPAMKLPDIKDNLEARLLLLERRLAERAGPVRLNRMGRGRLTLVIERQLELKDHP